MWSESTSNAIHEIALDIWVAQGLPGGPDLETQMAAYEIYKHRQLIEATY